VTTLCAGRPQLMGARVALLNLHRKGLLELPPPLRTNGNGRRHPLPTPAGDAGSPVCTAARALADRDRFIGWDIRQKKARLCRVVNNGRFLILPWVRSPNLPSMILGGCVRHVRADYALCHGVRPLLLESFVERGRFRGSCYKAANWIHAGVTRGRGRNDRLCQARLPAKDIWL